MQKHARVPKALAPPAADGLLNMGPTEVLWISAQPELPGDWPHHPGVWHLEFQTPEEALDALGAAEYAAIVLALPIADWNCTIFLKRCSARHRGFRS